MVSFALALLQCFLFFAFFAFCNDYNWRNLTLVILEHKCSLLGQLVCCKYTCVMHSFDHVLCVYFAINSIVVCNQPSCFMIAQVRLH